LKLFAPEGCGRDEAVPLDQASRVVGLPEGEQCLSQILDRFEGLHPDGVKGRLPS
jgi:hypothetical protein